MDSIRLIYKVSYVGRKIFSELKKLDEVNLSFCVRFKGVYRYEKLVLERVRKKN